MLVDREEDRGQFQAFRAFRRGTVAWLYMYITLHSREAAKPRRHTSIFWSEFLWTHENPHQFLSISWDVGFILHSYQINTFRCSGPAGPNLFCERVCRYIRSTKLEITRTISFEQDRGPLTTLVWGLAVRSWGRTGAQGECWLWRNYVRTRKNKRHEEYLPASKRLTAISQNGWTSDLKTNYSDVHTNFKSSGSMQIVKLMCARRKFLLMAIWFHGTGHFVR